MFVTPTKSSPIPLGLVTRYLKLVNPHLSVSSTSLPFTAAVFNVKPSHTNWQALQLNCCVFPPGKKHNMYVAYKAAWRLAEQQKIWRAAMVQRLFKSQTLETKLPQKCLLSFADKALQKLWLKAFPFHARCDMSCHDNVPGKNMDSLPNWQEIPVPSYHFVINNFTEAWVDSLAWNWPI